MSKFKLGERVMLVSLRNPEHTFSSKIVSVGMYEYGTEWNKCFSIDGHLEKVPLGARPSLKLVKLTPEQWEKFDAMEAALLEFKKGLVNDE